MDVSLKLNGTDISHDVEPRILLVHYLRDVAGATGTHWGCDTSNCGACIVQVDGTPVKSCTTLAVMNAGHDVVTVEGMANADGSLSPVQEGFMQEHGLQCGYCTPGMMMVAEWLLRHNPNPDEATIREAISGNICRCTGYENIIRAIRWAAEHSVTEGASA
jgi:aerobic carbon-monoxide dehydrogenase small subunit